MQNAEGSISDKGKRTPLYTRKMTVSCHQALTFNSSLLNTLFDCFKGSAVEIQASSARAEDTGGCKKESAIFDEVLKKDRAVEGRSKDVGATFVRVVERNPLRLGGLRPCATYRLSLRLAPNARHYLLESAR